MYNHKLQTDLNGNIASGPGTHFNLTALSSGTFVLEWLILKTANFEKQDAPHDAALMNILVVLLLLIYLPMRQILLEWMRFNLISFAHERV